MEPPAPPQPGDTSGSQTSAAAAASSSSGTGGFQPTIREEPYTITPAKLEDVGDFSIGHFTLAKPSNLPGSSVNQDVCLYHLNAADQFSLRILREVNHPNILHLQGVVHSSSSSIDILVESFSYGLLTEIEDYAQYLDANKLQQLRGLIRQLFEAIDELRTNGLYHGNLNLSNTYYEKGSALLKLGNFREKEGNDVVMSQYEDWDAAGTMINEIADILKNENPGLDLLLMEDLSRFLKNPGLPIEQVKDRALNHVYFWHKRQRISFFVHGVVQALKNNTFKQRVQALDFIPTNWNLDDHQGVLTAMNNNRLSEKKPKYTGDRVSYVQFVCGAYTHESELISDGRISHNVVVDNLVPPRLCLELVHIARDLGLHIC